MNFVMTYLEYHVHDRFVGSRSQFTNSQEWCYPDAVLSARPQIQACLTAMNWSIRCRDVCYHLLWDKVLRLYDCVWYMAQASHSQRLRVVTSLYPWVVIGYGWCCGRKREWAFVKSSILVSVSALYWWHEHQQWPHKGWMILSDTYNLPLGRVLYGQWCWMTTGVYLRAVVTSLLYTAHIISDTVWYFIVKHSPDELSIVQATTWSSSFICAAERKAISNLRSARNDRCFGAKYVRLRVATRRWYTLLKGTSATFVTFVSWGWAWILPP